MLTTLEVYKRLTIPISSQLPEYLDSLQERYQKNWIVRNHIGQIPEQAILVANHPYLHQDDWIDITSIPDEYGVDEKGWRLLQVRIIRTILWRNIDPTARIIIRAIGFRGLFENLSCIHLPEKNGFDWFKKQLDSYPKVIIYPEGGNQTGVVHTSFARIAYEQNLPVVFCQFSPTTSLFHPSSLVVKEITKVESVNHGIELFRKLCL